MTHTVLVTGGCGFIGSNFIRYMARTHPDTRLINLDAMTYAASQEQLPEESGQYVFVRGDIRDRGLLSVLFDRYDIDTVVNFAAESHVDRSIAGPELFLSTNVMGVQALLDVCRSSWRTNPSDPRCRTYRPGVRFLQISTDEVYGALGRTGFFRETDPLDPSSPYSASKASADLLVLSYFKTYALPVNLTRCSNNYGPRQFPEKLIPRMISCCTKNEPLPVYGDGLQVRDWIHVEDHCRAIDAVLTGGAPGRIYNVGANCERSNLDIIRLILRETGRSESLITHVPDRLGHDRRYAVDHSRLSRELGWQPQQEFSLGIRETIRWYLNHPGWLNTSTD